MTSSYTGTNRFRSCPRKVLLLPLIAHMLISSVVSFSWENKGKDIIKCSCGATVCVIFHPNLSEESRDGLCQKYLDMLASSHDGACPFRSYASRWSKAMQQCRSRGGDAAENSEQLAENDVVTEDDHEPERLMSKVGDIAFALSGSKGSFYVPPYLLALSDEFLRFEDCTDGVMTIDCVKEDAQRIHDQLQAGCRGDLKAQVTIPDEVMDFCREVRPDVNVEDALCQSDRGMQQQYLLSTFGWSICDESADEEGTDVGVVVKCSMCQARSLLRTSPSTESESPSRKKRRVDHGPSLGLIDSHRVYCPYVSGFSFGPGHQSNLPGWKVVVTKLLRAADKPKQCA